MLLLSFHSPLHHLAPAAGVQCKHSDRKPGAGFDGFRDRVGNIVQLEIEKDPETQSGYFPHAIGPARGEHFESDLDPTNRSLELTERGCDVARRLSVEDENQFTRHVEGSLLETIGRE